MPDRMGMPGYASHTLPLPSLQIVRGTPMGAGMLPGTHESEHVENKVRCPSALSGELVTNQILT